MGNYPQNQQLLDMLLRHKDELLRQKEASRQLCDMPKTQHYRMMLEQLDAQIADVRKKADSKS